VCEEAEVEEEGSKTSKPFNFVAKEAKGQCRKRMGR
jgi:hypothetical protein